MALETLKGVTEIGGYGAVVHTVRLLSLSGQPMAFHEMASHKPKDEPSIFIDHAQNALLFKIQNGPVKENGVNGCQVDTLIHAAKKIIEGLNEKFPSSYNRGAINCLEMAITELEARTKDREERNVEGKSEA